jgi:hypothetical protein
MDCYPSSEGQTNVVYNVHWRVTATSPTNHTVTNLDGTTSTVPYTASVYGTQGITFNASTAFTAFASLTQAEVIGWVQSAMGSASVTSLEANLDNQINTQITPTSITPALPWGA